MNLANAAQLMRSSSSQWTLANLKCLTGQCVGNEPSDHFTGNDLYQSYNIRDKANSIKADVLVGGYRNKDKSIWIPQRVISWLGSTYNLIRNIIPSTQKKVASTLKALTMSFLIKMYMTKHSKSSKTNPCAGACTWFM